MLPFSYLSPVREGSIARGGSACCLALRRWPSWSRRPPARGHPAPSTCRLVGPTPPHPVIDLVTSLYVTFVVGFVGHFVSKFLRVPLRCYASKSEMWKLSGEGKQNLQRMLPHHTIILKVGKTRVFADPEIKYCVNIFITGIIFPKWLVKSVRIQELQVIDWKVSLSLQFV